MDTTYQTSDLSMAAYLYCCRGVEMDDVQHPPEGERGPSVFVFRNVTPAIRRLWISGKGMVSAYEYATALRKLKALVVSRA